MPETDLAVIRISRLEQFLRGIDGAIASRNGGSDKTEQEHLEDARRAIESLVEEVERGTPVPVLWRVPPGRERSAAPRFDAEQAVRKQQSKRTSPQLDAILQALDGGTALSVAEIAARVPRIKRANLPSHLQDLKKRGLVEQAGRAKLGFLWRRVEGA